MKQAQNNDCGTGQNARIILETERLVLREMTPNDFSALKKILQDPEVMDAYNGPFSDRESQDWLAHQVSRYRENGFGLWAAVIKGQNEMIGQCGLTIQPWKETFVLETGWLFQKAYWHCGYASESASACRDYAFQVLHAESVYAIIPETNLPSRRVAERIGMTMADHAVKHYREVDMPHVLYWITNSVKEPRNANLC